MKSIINKCCSYHKCLLCNFLKSQLGFYQLQNSGYNESTWDLFDSSIARLL